MESLYYSVYKENVSINPRDFLKNTDLPYCTYSYVYDPETSTYNAHIEHLDIATLELNKYNIKYNSYIGEFNISYNPEKYWKFEGSECSQVSNISNLPTIENTTNIDISSTDQSLDNVISYNDINYSSNNLINELLSKRSLQLTSQAVDTYIQKSQYIYNNFSNKIVSIADKEYNEFAYFCSNIHNEAISYNHSTELPKSITVECVPDNEFIWRSDMSLHNIYNLPMLLVSYDQKTNEIKIEYKYNGIIEKDNIVTLCNYDYEMKFDSMRSFELKQIEKVFINSQYVKDIINKYNSYNKYYFYIVNLTTEFIHFNNVVEYNLFEEDVENVISIYTLFVFNESMTTNEILPKEITLNEFVNAWKSKNNKYTVDDIKRLVAQIKKDYKQYGQFAVNYALEHCANIQ